MAMATSTYLQADAMCQGAIRNLHRREFIVRKQALL
jgi:hypothetical protein